MNVETYIPTALLKPFIKGYRIIQSQDDLVNRLLPLTSIAIASRFEGQIGYVKSSTFNNFSPSVITGLRKSVRIINYLKNSGAIIVLFKETGATAFFREPLHELFEQSVFLDNFISQREISVGEDKLAVAQSNSERVAIIEQFLLSKLIDPRSDNLISAAIQIMNSSKGMIRIKELADTLYLSQDAFEKRFRKTVGTSAKQFSSIIRMRSAIQSMQQKQTFTEIAFEAGYFDQSHFNRDFKLFTGQTPTEFVKLTSPW